MIISGEIHLLEWLIAHSAPKFTGKNLPQDTHIEATGTKMVSCTEYSVLCIVDTMK